MPPLSPPTSPVHDQATAPPSTYFTERKNPRRTPYTSNRVIPSLRREDRVFNSIDGDGGKLGLMVLESMGIEMRDESSVESQNEDLGAIKVPGMKAGWMVMGVGDDNGSQFTDTQGSSMSKCH